MHRSGQLFSFFVINRLGDLWLGLGGRDLGGRESFLHARAVLDATGTFGQPNWAGTGGIPARGETYLAPQMSYHPDDVLGLRRERHAGKTTLVIGGGASAWDNAATALEAVSCIAQVDSPKPWRVASVV